MSAPDPAALPEPCLSEQCRSPIACGGWGYCRERNMRDDWAGPMPLAVLNARRRTAALRARAAQDSSAREG